MFTLFVLTPQILTSAPALTHVVSMHSATTPTEVTTAPVVQVTKTPAVFAQVRLLGSTHSTYSIRLCM